MSRRKSSQLVVVLALLVALAPPASAKIVVGKGVAGVKLGDSPAEVRAVLGPPKDTYKKSGVTNWFFEHEGRNAKPVDWVTFARKRVIGIETRTPGQRTKRGIGPGDSLKALKKAYPGAKCKSGDVVKHICTLSTPRGKRTIKTRFVFFKSEVSIVDVGRVGEFK